MSEELFRKNSLENLSSPDQLNDYVRITNPRGWAVALGCIAIVVAVTIWMFVGTIPDTISASGIIFPVGGTTTVMAPGSGKINDIRVSAGTTVQPHDIVAVVPQTSILEEIETLKKEANPDEEAILAKKKEYIDRSMIRSQVYGTVLSSKYLNEVVEEGEGVANIALIEEGTNNFAVVSYVDMDTALRLEAGMEVQITPHYLSREEYGYMYGYITNVGEYPVSQSDITYRVGNPQYVNGILLEEINYVEVQIEIVMDVEKTNEQNSAKWTNSAGNDFPLTIGTECDLSIVIKKQKPYELIF